MAYEHYSKVSRQAARFLDSVGDGTGIQDMAVDGSITPVDFYITPPAKKVLLIHRIRAVISDNGSFDADKFGNGLELVNGVEMGLTIQNTFIPFQQPVIIKTNADWASYAATHQYDTSGSGANFLYAEYDFVRDGAPFLLKEGQYFTIRIQDDLTALNHMRIRAGCASARCNHC